MRDDAALTADELDHCDRVRALIAAEIAAAGGWLSFERYMELVMYAPGLGYYSAGARKFGSGGDFTTAPEISRLFGACVARQCADVLNELTHGSILEIGAGSGQLAVDTLTRLETLGCLPERYRILEVSADLRERQRASIARHIGHLAERVTWLDSLPEDTFDGVILANEVLDALPVARFRWHGTARCDELGITLRDGDCVWAWRAAAPMMTSACGARSDAAGGWDPGYVSEYCPRLQSWAGAVTSSLRRGAVLWWDYGLPRPQYYLPERHEGTLICHFRQHANDEPLRYPGLQDISAWVDFTAVAEAGAAAGYEIAGFTTQAFFLAGLAIDGEMQLLARGDEHAFARLAREARQLMLPGEMGERFKAMAWTRDLDRELLGFSLQDLRHTL